MYYNNLKKVAEKYLKEAGITKLPVDISKIVSNVGLAILTKDQYIKMRGDNYIFNARAALVAYIGRQAIVYNDQEDYVAYAIAHELAHYILKHTIDAEDDESNADLLAMLFLAPPELLIESHLYSPADISLKCNVENDAANRYLNVLVDNDEIFDNKRSEYLYESKRAEVVERQKAKEEELGTEIKKILIEHDLEKEREDAKRKEEQKRLIKKISLIVSGGVAAIVLVLVGIWGVGKISNNPDNSLNTYSSPSPSAPLVSPSPSPVNLEPSPTPSNSPAPVVASPKASTPPEVEPSKSPDAQDEKKVYATKSGTKYHTKDCYYVAGKATKEMTIEEAEEDRLLPCLVCHPDKR